MTADIAGSQRLSVQTDAESRHADAAVTQAQHLREPAETDPPQHLQLEREAYEVASFIADNFDMPHWKIASNAKQADPALSAILNDASRMRMLEHLIKARLSGLPFYYVSETQAVIANALDRVDVSERTNVAAADRSAAGLPAKAFDPWLDVEAVVDFVAVNRRLAPHIIFQNLALADDHLKTIFSNHAHVEAIEGHIDRQIPASDARAVIDLHEVVAVALERDEAHKRTAIAEAARLADVRRTNTENMHTSLHPETVTARLRGVDTIRNPFLGEQDQPAEHFYLRTLNARGVDEDVAYSSLHDALRAFLMQPYSKRPRVLMNSQLMASFTSNAGPIPSFRDENVEVAYLNAFASPEHQLAIRQVHQISKFLLPNLAKADDTIIDAYYKAPPELQSLLSNPVRMEELAGLLSKRSGIDSVDLRRIQALLTRQADTVSTRAPAPPNEPAPSMPTSQPDQMPHDVPLAAPMQTTGNGFRPAGQSPAERPVPISVTGILERITHKTKRDGSVEYSLDGQPTFIDHGDQILMIGAADHNEQAIVAALLVAKEKYGGAFELTGDIDFKQRAIEIMIKYKIEAMLKSPEQDAMRRDLLKATEAGPARPASAAAPAMPVDLKRLVPSAGPVNEERPPSDEAMPSAPPAPAASPKASGQTVALAEPINRLAGKVLGFGMAPYEHKPGQKMSYFVELENADGRTRTTWGVDLERAAQEQNLNIGDAVVLQNLGRTPVEVRQDVVDKDGKVIGDETVVSHRNAWEIEFIKRAKPMDRHSVANQPVDVDDVSAATAPTTSFVDAGAWWASQQTIIQNLSVDYTEMQADLERLGPQPPAGLVYWFDDGRPSEPPPDAARILHRLESVKGEPDAMQSKPILAIHAITALPDGRFVPSVLLFKSATGDYLQGFVRSGKDKQEVIANIVSDPAAAGGQTIRLSKLTMAADGPHWQPMGHGSAINRNDDGSEVYFDEVRFTIGDSTLVARVSDRLDHRLRQKIGFEKPLRERPRDETSGAPDAAALKRSKSANDKKTPSAPAARKSTRQRSVSQRG